MGPAAEEAGSSAYPFPADTQVPAWAQGPVALAYRLGVVNGVGGGKFGGDEPLTRAQVAAILSRALQVFFKAAFATGQPLITKVDPAPMGIGLPTTISGHGFGSQAGTVTWQTAGGTKETWPVTSWTDSTVTVTIPADAQTGNGKLTINNADGLAGSVSAELDGSKLVFGKPLADGRVPLQVAGKTYYVKSSDVEGLRALPPGRQMDFLSQLQIRFGSTAGGSSGGTTGRAPTWQAPQYAPSPLVVRPATTTAAVSTAQAQTSAAACDTDGCVTLYGPGATPFAPDMSSSRVSVDEPCETIWGYQVCSGVASAEALLGGVVYSPDYTSYSGYPNGYFTEVGTALSGVGLITAASMDATLGFSYHAKSPGDFMRIEVKVITNQVDGGVGVAGAGVAPVNVYTVGNGIGQQQDVVASRLGTLSASVGSWPDLSTLDMAEQSLGALDAINDTAQTIWQLDGLPGETGVAHVSSFSWSGYAPADGSNLDVSVDTQAIAAANGFSQTEVNAVSGVVVVKVTEFGSPPTAYPCTDTTPARAVITGVTPALAGPGDTVSVSGSGFGQTGTVYLYSSVNGTADTAQVLSWSPESVTVRVPEVVPGAYSLWVAPDSLCTKPSSTSFTVAPPSADAIHVVMSWQGPHIYVTGHNFGPTFSAYGTTMLAGELELLPDAGGQTINLVPDSWEQGGFEAESPLLAPGAYELKLVQHYQDYNGGYVLAGSTGESGASGTSNGPFVAVPHPTLFSKDVTTVLGKFTIPAARLDSLSPTSALPGTAVAAMGAGFGSIPGSVWLVNIDNVEAGAGATGGGNVPAARSYVVTSSAVTSWTDNQVVFTVPKDVAAGRYSVYVLPAGYAPWQEPSAAAVVLEVKEQCSCCPGTGQ